MAQVLRNWRYIEFSLKEVNEGVAEVFEYDVVYFLEELEERADIAFLRQNRPGIYRYYLLCPIDIVPAAEGKEWIDSTMPERVGLTPLFPEDINLDHLFQWKGGRIYKVTR